LTENSLPHTVQRSVTVFQPMRSSTSLLQILHFMLGIPLRAEIMGLNNQSEDFTLCSMLYALCDSLFHNIQFD
jgi:hypothetical protein